VVIPVFIIYIDINNRLLKKRSVNIMEKQLVEREEVIVGKIKNSF
jgi:hypothetical protein